MSRILALDVGDKRIGVALSDPTGILASPYTIVERTSDETAIDHIISILYEYGVKRIIVGLPRSMNGSIGHQAEKVQLFADALKKATDIPVDFRDERLTTVTAVRLKQEASKRKPDKRTRYDAMAASIILQEFLDEQSLE